MMVLTLSSITSWEWAIIILAGMLIGMTKTGIAGISMVTIPLMAAIFGGKLSTGVLLPALIFADLFAVGYYHRHANWIHLFKALPWAIAGLFIGVWTGLMISNDHLFKLLIAFVVLVGVGLMIWRDRFMKVEKIPDHWSFAALLGLAGGFTSMIGNAAGPVMAIYLLALRLPKNSYIGTGAWFFLIINVIKFPLHLFLWHTISLASLELNLAMLPGIAAGAFAGIYLVKIISDKFYRWFVLTATVLAATIMFL